MRKPKKQTPFLDFYNECMETGLLTKQGLCTSVSELSYRIRLITGDVSHSLYNLFDYHLTPYYDKGWDKEIPTIKIVGAVPFKPCEISILRAFWAYGEEIKDTVYTQNEFKSLEQKIIHEFTPLRQNIILLCAALNGEFDNEPKNYVNKRF